MKYEETNGTRIVNLTADSSAIDDIDTKGSLLLKDKKDWNAFSYAHMADDLVLPWILVIGK